MTSAWFPRLALATVLAVPAAVAFAASEEAPDAAPAAKAIAWVDSYEDALALAKKHGYLVLVDFYTDWCGWCRKLDRDVFSKDSFSEAAAGIVAVKVNAEKHRELANHFGATSYPRLFFLSSDGLTLEQVRGYLSLEDFTAKVKQVKAGDTEYDRYREAAGDPTNLEAVRRFARFLSDTGRVEEAIPYWQQVHDTTLQKLFENPSVPTWGFYHREALVELGRGYLAVGLGDVGRQHLEEAISSYPSTPEAAGAMVTLADLKAEAGDPLQARDLLQRVINDAPRSPAARDAALRLRRLDAAPPR